MIKEKLKKNKILEEQMIYSEIKELYGEAISVIPTMTMAIRIKSKSSVFQKKEPHMKYTI